jgi:hypothetical protein
MNKKHDERGSANPSLLLPPGFALLLLDCCPGRRFILALSTIALCALKRLLRSVLEYAAAFGRTLFSSL